MTGYASAQELISELRAVIESLRLSGRANAAAELSYGLGALNGLTDGWAMLLESIHAVLASSAEHLDAAEEQALNRIGAAVHAAVYRR
jgi:hypothetical protein